MTDVRLTAINPDDSQAYPVACNSKGELVVEPQVQGDKGDKGDKGDQGDPGPPAIHFLAILPVTLRSAAS